MGPVPVWRGLPRQGAARGNGMAYEQYISSMRWLAKRRRVLDRDGRRCQTCFRVPPEVHLQVHHKTYERLGDEPLNHLITLCSECHEAVTSVVRWARYEEVEVELANVARTTPTTMREHTVVTDVSPGDVWRPTPAAKGEPKNESHCVTLSNVRRPTPVRARK